MDPNTISGKEWEGRSGHLEFCTHNKSNGKTDVKNSGKLTFGSGLGPALLLSSHIDIFLVNVKCSYFKNFWVSGLIATSVSTENIPQRPKFTANTKY